VVTGVNLGYNAGTAFLASSGTVWAAAEAAFAGLPAIAFSTGPTATDDDFASWRSASLQPDARPRWSVLADVAAAVTRDLGDATLLDHCDLVSVNMPWDADEHSGRTVTTLTELAYGPLFVPSEQSAHPDQGAWDFTTQLDIRVGDAVGAGDLDALRAGEVSITPVVLPRSAEVPSAARAELDRPRRD
jgi:5'/3'-nucleotidase SurE